MGKTAIFAMAILIGTTAGVSAHTNTERFDRQRTLIEEGRRDGSITWREGRVLRKEQREIARLKNAFYLDGYLSRKERKILHSMQNDARRHIRKEASDGWRRLRWLPRVGR
jgi:hypothetical protein